MKYNYERIYKYLLSKNGRQYWWPADSVWEVMLGAILIQNTNAKNVGMSLDNLRQATELDPKKILKLTNDELIDLIRPSGFYKNKSKSIISLFNFFEKNDWNIERVNTKYSDANELRKILLTVHGIGNETADVLLLYIFKRSVFVADTYSRRLISFFEDTPIKDLNYMSVKQAMEIELSDFSLVDFQEFHALIDDFSKEFIQSDIDKSIFKK